LADRSALTTLDGSSGLRVLFMSGYSEDAISTMGVLNSGLNLLNKPFRKADLAQAVRDVIDEERPDIPPSVAKYVP